MMIQHSRKTTVFAGPGPLPDEFNDGMVMGGLYAVTIQSPPTRYRIVTHTLLSNLARGVRCTLITPLPLDEFFYYEDDAVVQTLLEAIQKNRLAVLSMMEGYATKLFRHGPQRFLADLVKWGKPGNGLLVIDHADQLFTAHDVTVALNQAKVYRQWLQECHCSALALFLEPMKHEVAHQTLRYLSDQFSGMGHLTVGDDGLALHVDFWSLQRAQVIGKCLPVVNDGRGELHMSPSMVLNRRRSYRSAELVSAVRHLPASMVNANATGAQREEVMMATPAKP